MAGDDGENLVWITCWGMLEAKHGNWVDSSWPSKFFHLLSILIGRTWASGFLHAGYFKTHCIAKLWCSSWFVCCVVFWWVSWHLDLILIGETFRKRFDIINSFTTSVLHSVSGFKFLPSLQRDWSCRLNELWGKNFNLYTYIHTLVLDHRNFPPNKKRVKNMYYNLDSPKFQKIISNLSKKNMKQKTTSTFTPAIHGRT